jgi:endoglucanase
MNQSIERVTLFLLIGFLTISGLGQNQNPSLSSQTAFSRVLHLKRGINVSHWFSQSPNDYSAHHTATVTDDDDIALIARMGFDNVRLSIDATPLEQAPVDVSGLNADFVARLDHALDTMLSHGLAVQVDLHPEGPFKIQLRTSDAAVGHLTDLWRKLAAHYANRDPDLVFFEVMNEPEQNDPYRWAGIQARVAAAIREVAPRNTIIATGPNYSDIVDLLTQHPPKKTPCRIFSSKYLIGRIATHWSPIGSIIGTRTVSG